MLRLIGDKNNKFIYREDNLDIKWQGMVYLQILTD